MSENVANRQLTQETEGTFGLDAAFVDEVATSLLADNRVRVKELVSDLHYADMADLLERLDAQERRLLVETIRDNFNADVLPELAEVVRDQVMDALGFEDFASKFILARLRIFRSISHRETHIGLTSADEIEVINGATGHFGSRRHAWDFFGEHRC